jgi:hypothetical protein
VPPDIYAPVPVTEDPLGPFKTLNAMLAENPPSSTHALVLEQFSGLGVGAGLDVEAQPEAVRQGLARATTVGMALLRDQFTSGDWATIVSGWRYPPPEEGRFGNDFLRRAADQSLAGIAANDPAESMYLMNFQDITGARLDPKRRYTLRFPPDGLPPVDAFWSLTAYTAEDLNLIANPIDRYTVGDHASRLQLDGDGGLSIHLQPDPPTDERESNWLPTSPESPWFVLLRMYRPRPGALDGSWRCPGISRAD